MISLCKYIEYKCILSYYVLCLIIYCFQVCAKCGDRSHATIYRPLSKKIVKHLENTTATSTYSCAAFSGDSKHLVVSSHDSIEVWQWEQEKLLCTVTIPDGQVSRICCSPLSTSQTPLITSSGKGHMRMWIQSSGDRLSSKTLMTSHAKEQARDFIDHAWLNSYDSDIELGVVATVVSAVDSSSTSNSVLLFQVSRKGKQSTKVEVAATIPIAVIENGTKINCISQYSMGFAIGGSGGFLALFQPENGTSSEFSQFDVTNTKSDDDFCCICPSEKDDRVLVLSNTKSLYELERNQVIAVSPRELHNDSIIECDIAMSRPLCITASKDKCVKIWCVNVLQDITFFTENADVLKLVILHKGT